MKDNWTNKMKQKLEGHKMSPPDGLWDSISHEMGKPYGLKPLSRLTGNAQRYWAAAAVVIALVGFFAFYPSNPVEEKSEASSSPVKTLASDEPTISTKPSISVKSVKPSLLAQGTTPVRTKQETIAETQKETNVEPQKETIVEPQQITIEETNEQAFAENKTETEIKAETETKTETKPESHQPKQTYLPDVTDYATTASHSESSNKWTLGLAGSNGLLLATNTSVEPLYAFNVKGSYALIGTDNSYTEENYDKYSMTDIVSKHNIPLRIGLSLQYQLSNRLALHSGISYTYLKSEFSVPLYNNISYDQKLSYLGIPLGITWQIWSTDHFSIYLSGGTLVEKCISAEVTDGKLDSRPWQLSVNASAGAEYNIIRQLGIYLEPSLGYYFDDGTSLEHYYKEHPLSPSIQFGLRFHLK